MLGEKSCWDEWGGEREGGVALAREVCLSGCGKQGSGGGSVCLMARRYVLLEGKLA